MNPLHNGKGYIAFTVLHFFAFAMALTVCALYGVDLTRAREAGVAADPKWVFAEVVGCISILTTLIYLIPFVLRFAGVPIWNLILSILWIAVFGVFGSMYIKEDPEGNQAIQRMKNAVWVDLSNALLWLIIAITSGVYWWGHRERRSRFTGRARGISDPASSGCGWEDVEVGIKRRLGLLDSHATSQSGQTGGCGPKVLDTDETEPDPSVEKGLQDDEDTKVEKAEGSQSDAGGQIPTIPITFDAFPVLKTLFFMSPLSSPVVATALNHLTSQAPRCQ